MHFKYLDNFLDDGYKPIEKKEGLPFLFQNNEESFYKIRASVVSYLEAERLRLAEAKSLATDLTRKKVEKHIEARTKQLGRLKKILGTFGESLEATGAASLNPYEELLFRDWCWEDQTELHKYQEFIAKNFNEGDSLFLGAGACGLSYALAKQYEKLNIVAADINPFLLLPAYKIMSGKSVKLVDAPHFPSSEAAIAKSFTAGPREKLKNLFPVFADFNCLPFKANAFDHINATWFLDIIDVPIEKSLQAIVYHLKENGSFSFIGPSNFHKENIAESLTHEEIIECLKKVFETVEYHLEEIDYLNSGYGSQRRIERVLFAHAATPKKEKGMRLRSPQKDSFKYDERLQFKIAETATLAKIFQHINGSMTYEELAKKISAEFGFPLEQSLAYAKSLIGKIQS